MEDNPDTSNRVDSAAVADMDNQALAEVIYRLAS